MTRPDAQQQAREIVIVMKEKLQAEAEYCRTLPGVVIPGERWYEDMQTAMIAHALREAEQRGLERGAQIAEGGSFLSQASLEAKWGRACAAAIRREKETI